MNNHNKIEKAKEQIVEFTTHLHKYEGDINKHKVIKELEKIYETLGD